MLFIGIESLEITRKGDNIACLHMVLWSVTEEVGVIYVQTICSVCVCVWKGMSAVSFGKMESLTNALTELL